MKVKRYILGIVFCTFIAAVLAATYAYAIIEPQSLPGDFLFKISYIFSFNKEATLQGFDANLKEYNGGYLPESSSKFLCDRLQKNVSKKEIEAIVDFYVLKTARGREGMCICTIPPQTKQRVTRVILDRLKKYSLFHAMQALVLIENLRQGQFLGKAHLIYHGNKSLFTPKGKKWWKKHGIVEAESQFRKWWTKYPTWEQKEKHNPLAHSNFSISAP